MSKVKCVAIVLAGGRSERLGPLTEYVPKPLISFGGACCLMDFSLHGCISSGIANVGIVAQYKADAVKRHVEMTYPARPGHALEMLMPKWYAYAGTADAVLKNIRYITRLDPEHILILPGDLICRMDYGELLRFHGEAHADVTVLAAPAAWPGDGRHELLCAQEGGRITARAKRPGMAGDVLAAMGAYVFSWPALRKWLLKDRLNRRSGHDLTRDILPGMIAGGSAFAYAYDGYWCDAGTVDGLWRAHMDLLANPDAAGVLPALAEPVYRVSTMTEGGKLEESMTNGVCFIGGQVRHSVLGHCTVGKGSRIVDSVIMPYATIGENVTIRRAIIGPGARIAEHTVIDAGRVETAIRPYGASEMGLTVVEPYSVVSPVGRGGHAGIAI